jgi:hypothetical protein
MPNSGGSSWSATVVGAERVDASLDPARRWAGFGTAVLRGGLAIGAEMQRAAKPHHDTGRLEQHIHATPPIGSGLNIEVRVGIGTAGAPEGRPLAFGWKSRSGLQPPTAPIMAWLKRHPEAMAGSTPTSGRGKLGGKALSFRSAGGEAELRSRAFLIARAIGRRGYRFGSSDWFNAGIAAGKPKLEAIIRAALRGRPTG